MKKSIVVIFCLYAHFGIAGAAAPAVVDSEIAPAQKKPRTDPCVDLRQEKKKPPEKKSTAQKTGSPAAKPVAKP